MALATQNTKTDYRLLGAVVNGARVLRPVAMRAERLDVVNAILTAFRERYYMVCLQLAGTPATEALVAVLLAKGNPFGGSEFPSVCPLVGTPNVLPYAGNLSVLLGVLSLTPLGRFRKRLEVRSSECPVSSPDGFRVGAISLPPDTVGADDILGSVAVLSSLLSVALPVASVSRFFGSLPPFGCLPPQSVTDRTRLTPRPESGLANRVEGCQGERVTAFGATLTHFTRFKKEVSRFSHTLIVSSLYNCCQVISYAFFSTFTPSRSAISRRAKTITAVLLTPFLSDSAAKSASSVSDNRIAVCFFSAMKKIIHCITFSVKQLDNSYTVMIQYPRHQLVTEEYLRCLTCMQRARVGKCTEWAAALLSRLSANFRTPCRFSRESAAATPFTSTGTQSANCAKARGASGKHTPCLGALSKERSTMKDTEHVKKVAPAMTRRGALIALAGGAIAAVAAPCAAKPVRNTGRILAAPMRKLPNGKVEVRLTPEGAALLERFERLPKEAQIACVELIEAMTGTGKVVLSSLALEIGQSMYKLGKKAGDTPENCVYHARLGELIDTSIFHYLRTYRGNDGHLKAIQDMCNTIPAGTALADGRRVSYLPDGTPVVIDDFSKERGIEPPNVAP